MGLMISLARTAAKFRVWAKQPSYLLTSFDSWQAFSMLVALSVVMANTLSCSLHEISVVSRLYARTSPVWLSFSCLVSRTCEVNTTYLALEVLWYMSRNLICYQYSIYMNILIFFQPSASLWCNGQCRSHRPLQLVMTSHLLWCPHSQLHPSLCAVFPFQQRVGLGWSAATCCCDWEVCTAAHKLGGGAWRCKQKCFFCDTASYFLLTIISNEHSVLCNIWSCQTTRLTFRWHNPLANCRRISWAE